MSLILGVHGIAKQQLGRRSMLRTWDDALGDGLERAGVPARDSRISLDIAFYGNLFLPEVKTGGRKGGETDLDAWLLDNLSDHEIADLVKQAALDVPKVVFDDVQGEELKGYTRAPTAVQLTLRALDKHFGPAAGVLYLGSLRQVRRYLRSPDTKGTVDSLVAKAMASEVDGAPPRILLGHSLGSVIAYEYARQNPDRKIDLLLTLGSPLGLRMVRDQLPPTEAIPANVARWVNVRDTHDPVACAGDLSRFWPAVDDRTVNNQGDAHAAERYLRKKQTGEAVRDAARGITP